MPKQFRPYGAWESPITPRALATKPRILDVQWDSNGERLVWLEGRGKQNVLVVQDSVQAPRDVTGDFSVRGGVGYGGGEFTVHNGVVYYVSGGRLYRQSLDGGEAKAITPAFGGAASPVVSRDGRWLVYVHAAEDVDGLALVDTVGEMWSRKLDFRADFYAQPTLRPDGTRLAFITWDFPHMAWDSSQLVVATLETGSDGVPHIASRATIAGDANTSVSEPRFSPDGRLLAYISDASGWSQLYVYDIAAGTHTRLTEVDAEFGLPNWVQGIRTYGWTHDSRAIYAARNDRGFFSVWRIDAASGRAEKVDGLDEYTYFSQIAVSPTRDAVAMIASSGMRADRVISLEPDDDVPDVLYPVSDVPTIRVYVERPRGLLIHRRASSELIPDAALSRPQAMEWTSFDGELAYGLYYAPTSTTYEGAGLPPLIVYPHHGPTSQAAASYSPAAQFLATRGFAVLEVNYRGSTGYGKAYKDKLRGAWGMYDVEDSAAGAAALAARGLADESKCVIMGSSAGGYTVLQSLVTKPGFYKAGVCAYGISNQFALALDAEFKFESRYNDTLLGVLPDAAALYRERSPLFHAERISDPLILFHGTEDKVVPKAQTDALVNVLRARRVPHEYHVFEGEGHGWRKPETIEAYYTLVMDFLKRYVIYV